MSNKITKTEARDSFLRIAAKLNADQIEQFKREVEILLKYFKQNPQGRPAQT